MVVTGRMATMNLRVVLLACATAAALAGCAGPGRISAGAEGFTEERLAEGSYLLDYRGSGPLPADALWCLWVYHGATLTLRQHFDGMTIARSDDVDSNPIPRYGARGKVQMVQLERLPSNVAALDAAALVRMLDGFVRSGGTALPPARLDVVKAAAVYGRGPAGSPTAVTMDDLRKLLPPE